MRNNKELIFTKRHLTELPFCYAVTTTMVDGQLKYLFAPDGRGPCLAFNSDSLKMETLVADLSGSMSMVPVPGKNGDFLAVKEFNLDFHAEKAEIVYVGKTSEGWASRKVLDLPYIHRFDIIERGGTQYLIFCTVCSEKKSVRDWSSPGGIYVAELPDEFSEGAIQLTQVAGGMTRNHGYWRMKADEYTYGMTACDQGVYEVFPPAVRGGEWAVKKVLDTSASDIALCDIDGDGELEMAAIEPFHGNRFVVYKKSGGSYQKLYEYPDEVDFCHVVWGGELRGEPAFIGGCRAINKELFMLRWRNGVVEKTIIEKDMGPSNVCVVPGKAADILLVANREAGEAALYTVTD